MIYILLSLFVFFYVCFPFLPIILPNVPISVTHFLYFYGLLKVLWYKCSLRTFLVLLKFLVY